MATRLVIVGGGRMGEALVAGLLRAGWAEPTDLAVAEKYPRRRAELAGIFPGLEVVERAIAADGAVVAVKPPEVEEACADIAAAGANRVLSIAAGVGIADLEGWLGGKTPLVRAMPNTPALVGAGAAAIAPGTHAGEEDLAWAERLLLSVGTVERVPEKLLDAVTGLSASGPAYVFMVAEALIDAGVAVGLPRATSSALTIQMILGSARLMAESGDSPEVLRAAVTSPAGTTAAGLAALETRAVRAAFLEAVKAATERAHQLGQPGAGH